MAFGWPTLYWQLNLLLVEGGAEAWDAAIERAAHEYRHHVVFV
jgi:hypothetical protein